jgi:CRISPR-associated protein Csd1
LIKLVLRSGQKEEEDRMVSLDLDSPNPAYRCGRLFAVLEEAQRLAVPGIKATIGDRFYGAASSAPISVFARLLQGAKAHLGKLERDRPGAYRGLQRRLEEVMGGLKEFPRTLSLEQQAMFALGYYHQKAFDRAQAHEAMERRKAALVTGVIETSEASQTAGVVEDEGEPPAEAGR